MANMKSAKKRIRLNESRRQLNAPVKSEMRSTIKRVEKLISENNVEDAQATLKVAVKKIDKAVGKGIVHKNNGARQKSRLTTQVNALEA